MTLNKKLLIITSVILLLLLAIGFFVQCKMLQFEHQQQQRVLLNKSTQFIKVALIPYIEIGDTQGIEGTLDVIFDGKYHQKIEITTFPLDEIFTRTSRLTSSQAPAWFTGLGLFPQLTSQASVMVHSEAFGDFEVGRVELTNNPASAYNELWGEVSKLFILYLTTFIVCVVLFFIIYNLNFRSLIRLRDSAIRCQKSNDGSNIELPKESDLKPIAQTINALSTQLKVYLDGKSKQIEDLYKMAYEDSTSGLGNRDYFISQVKEWIAEDGVGGMMIISIDILDEIYQKDGFMARDQFLKSIGETLQLQLKPYDRHEVARFSDTEFAILIPGVNQQELLNIAENLNGNISNILVNPLSAPRIISTIGAAMRTDQESLPELLSTADQALLKARMDHLEIYIKEDKSQEQLGRFEWKRIIETAINQQQIHFYIQPVFAIDQKTRLHTELFSYIDDGQKTYSAGEFMPAVEQFRLGDKLDQHILEHLIPLLESHPEMNFALNWSRTAITNEKFCAWIIQTLIQNKGLAKRLCFEIQESVLLKASDRIQNTLEELRAHGYMWGIDQFGRHLHATDYLKRLHPDYVKIDHTFTKMLVKDINDTTCLSAICDIAHGAGARAIVTQIESQAVLDSLKGLPIDGYQGYINPPHPLK
ncbi:bifunctional diguanylate cyclase/phosphodiesterase [Dongshaea marina]|uniref:bifunctional diguanylate cyclase/phosphodiesterase n=1 Tax=Dongshaea marina TaxID=2047966 RepID=UPI00131F2550|nr:EAL domain-containing protein [Dongshaea marina]